MSKRCDICGKSTSFGNKRSFSVKASRRSWTPNIKKVRAIVDGEHKRINVCTRCLRSGLVERPKFIKEETAQAE